MALSMTQTGFQFLGNLLTNNETPEDLELHLYKNDLAPDSASVLGDFTEAEFSGYSSTVLTAANWGITAASTTVFLYSEAIIFEADASVTDEDIYGYYVTNTTGDVMWAERFANPPNVINNNGDIINITPRITFTNSGT